MIIFILFVSFLSVNLFSQYDQNTPFPITEVIVRSDYPVFANELVNDVFKNKSDYVCPKGFEQYLAELFLLNGGELESSLYTKKVDAQLKNTGQNVDFNNNFSDIDIEDIIRDENLVVSDATRVDVVLPTVVYPESMFYDKLLNANLVPILLANDFNYKNNFLEEEFINGHYLLKTLFLGKIFTSLDANPDCLEQNDMTLECRQYFESTKDGMFLYAKHFYNTIDENDELDPNFISNLAMYHLIYNLEAYIASYLNKKGDYSVGEHIAYAFALLKNIKITEDVIEDIREKVQDGTLNPAKTKFFSTNKYIIDPVLFIKEIILKKSNNSTLLHSLKVVATQAIQDDNMFLFRVVLEYIKRTGLFGSNDVMNDKYYYIKKAIFEIWTQKAIAKTYQGTVDDTNDAVTAASCLKYFSRELPINKNRSSFFNVQKKSTRLKIEALADYALIVRNQYSLAISDPNGGTTVSSVYGQLDILDIDKALVSRFGRTNSAIINAFYTLNLEDLYNMLRFISITSDSIDEQKAMFSLLPASLDMAVMYLANFSSPRDRIRNLSSCRVANLDFSGMDALERENLVFLSVVKLSDYQLSACIEEIRSNILAGLTFRTDYLENEHFTNEMMFFIGSWFLLDGLLTVGLPAALNVIKTGTVKLGGKLFKLLTKGSRITTEVAENGERFVVAIEYLADGSTNLRRLYKIVDTPFIKGFQKFASKLLQKLERFVELPATGAKMEELTELGLKTLSNELKYGLEDAEKVLVDDVLNASKNRSLSSIIRKDMEIFSTKGDVVGKFEVTYNPAEQTITKVKKMRILDSNGRVIEHEIEEVYKISQDGRLIPHKITKRILQDGIEMSSETTYFANTMDDLARMRRISDEAKELEKAIKEYKDFC